MDQAVQVRAALEASGLDHGPISVHERMKTMGLAAPSVASLARIFRERGVARVEPRKRPRAAWRRFVYPAPNACWQLDATQYVLTRGRTCVIFQLQDDHSRLAIASHVASGETAEAAVAVFIKGAALYGVPQRLLTDNGAALNPSRRGHRGKLFDHVTALGVEAITGKPYRPTTQGKNERFHQTLFRWLDKQPIAKSLQELQTLVDEFDVIYNEQRPHQGLPGQDHSPPGLGRDRPGSPSSPHDHLQHCRRVRRGACGTHPASAPEATDRPRRTAADRDEDRNDQHPQRHVPSVIRPRRTGRLGPRRADRSDVRGHERRTPRRAFLAPARNPLCLQPPR